MLFAASGATATLILIPLAVNLFSTFLGPLTTELAEQIRDGVVGSGASLIDPTEPFTVTTLSGGSSPDEIYALTGEVSDEDHAMIVGEQRPESLIPLGGRRDSIVLVGLWDEQLSITGVRAIGLERTESPTGTFIDFRGRGTGGDAPRTYSFDLDLVTSNTFDDDGKPFFDETNIPLAKGDSVILNITTHPPRDGMFYWMLEIEVLGEQSGPFRTYLGAQGGPQTSADDVDPANRFVVASPSATYDNWYGRDPGTFKMIPSDVQLAPVNP